MKKKPPAEIREIFIEGDLFGKLKVARYGNRVEVDCFEHKFMSHSIRTLIRVQAAIAILIDELLQLGTQTPGEPAFVQCFFCTEEFYVPKFDPKITAWYCRDQKLRECHERETGTKRFRRP